MMKGRGQLGGVEMKDISVVCRLKAAKYYRANIRMPSGLQRSRRHLGQGRIFLPPLLWCHL